MKTYWVKMGLISLFFSLVYVAATDFCQERIRKNISGSLPFSYFIATKIEDIRPHLLVVFDHPLAEIPLAKEIIGVPGDTIAIRNDTLYINEVNYGLIQEKNSSGFPIHPISEGIIPEGHLFVYAPHPQSYDSRYAEFGLIPFSSLKEALWPLF